MVCLCGGRLKAVGLVTEAERAKELLEQFGMPATSLPITRARSPDWIDDLRVYSRVTGEQLPARSLDRFQSGAYPSGGKLALE
jgi:hypothetical protein